MKYTFFHETFRHFMENVFRDLFIYRFIIMFTNPQLFSSEYKPLGLAPKMQEQICRQFYAYRNDSELFFEICAYFSYEANAISFYKHDMNNESFLIIKGDDGGLTDDNLYALRNEALGVTTNNNISYMGAGARTAAKQWTEAAGGYWFAVCDHNSCVTYAIGGSYGLGVKNMSKQNLNNQINLPTENGYTYWVLKWNQDRINNLRDTLIPRLKFMYNERLTTNLKLNFLGKNIIPSIKLFITPTTKNMIFDNNGLFYKKSKLFTPFSGSAKMLFTRVKKKNFTWQPNKQGLPGKTLLIKSEEHKICQYYHYDRSTMMKRTSTENYIYDTIECDDWGNEDEIDEEFNFSGEVMFVSGEINERRKQFAEYFKLGKPGEDVHGVRLLMKGTKGSNFITSNIIGKKRGLGHKIGLVLYIHLTKQQYKKYARPNINRNNQWNCDDFVKEVADNLYDYWISKIRESVAMFEKQQNDKKLKEKELQRKLEVEKIKTRYETPTANQHTKATRIQSHCRKFLDMKNYIEKRTIALDKAKKRKQKKKENAAQWNKELNQWVENQRKKDGILYIRSTEDMRKRGMDYEGAPISKIGMSTQGPERHKQYLNHEYIPYEELKEEWQEEKCKYAKDAETNLKRRLKQLGYNFQDYLKSKGKIINGTEFFICAVETIKKIMTEEIEHTQRRYDNDKKRYEDYLKRKYPH